MRKNGLVGRYGLINIENVRCVLFFLHLPSEMYNTWNNMYNDMCMYECGIYHTYIINETIYE